MSCFAKRLKNLRTNKGLTQQEVANVLGVGRATIAGYETKGKQPDYEKLQKLSTLFDVTVDYLIGKSNNPKTIKAMVQEAGVKYDAERGLTQDELPEKLKELGVYLQLAEKMKKEEVDPEAVERLIEVLKKHK